MNFTKEYIELCKDKRIQGLRPELEYFDMYCFITNLKEIKVYGYDVISERDNYYWLPDGDSLDDEIVKICKERDYEYLLTYAVFPKYCDYVWEVSIAERNEEGDMESALEFINANPLIAKLNLLIKLLGE